MAFKNACLTITVACCLIVVMEALPRHHSIQKRGLRLCGRMLVEALASVCQNEYYDPNRMQYRKRNYGGYTSDNYPGWDNSMSDNDGFTDPRTALDFFGLQIPRLSRGVADECCTKSCSYSQLVSYCGPATRSSGDRRK